ncbi:MAG: amidohydrolase [Bacillota bacterium]
METSLQYLKDDLREIRRTLHKIPEVGFKEYKTKDFIKSQLESYGITEITDVLATGLVARIPGKTSENTIALRADMDALPVTEKEHAFSSTHNGFMHACGHDGHMTMLLGVAKHLMQQKITPPVDVIFIFQPAEEHPGGAEPLIATGILQQYNVKYVIGCHLFPTVAEGKIACKVGAMMARNGEITIDIKGKSAHGAQPHLGSDAILAAGGVISGLHSIISRNISPLESGVVTFGTIEGGEVGNVISDFVTLKGTLRAFSDEVYFTIQRRLREIVEGISGAYGCQGSVQFNDMYRVVNNDASLVARLKEVAGERYEESEAYMLSEDFSFFQETFQGVFFFLGTKNEGKGMIAPLHNSEFNFDESVLLVGVEMFLKMLGI